MQLPPGTDLSDDLLTEILLRLPPKSVLRSRAVCKHWRLATTADSFLAAYSRRRPLHLILYRKQSGSHSNDAIDTVPLLDGGGGGGDGCRRLLNHGYNLKCHASCDGLLLFSLHQGKSFVICNPATRQCARFPALVPTPCVWVLPSGFYLHRPSGEHRVLCFAIEIKPGQYYDSIERVYKNHVHGPGAPGNRPRPVHYVFSTGAAQPRRLGPFPECLPGYRWFPPPCGVDVGGTLHWARHPWTGGKNSSDMLAFDTVSETFWRMPLPPAAAAVSDHLINLFDMRGTLAASVVGEWPYMDVWALDDYAGETWSCRFRVEMPAAAKSPFGVKCGAAVAALDGDVLVLFAVDGWVTLYDVKEKRTVRVVRRGDNRGGACWCVHRESLAPAVIDGLPCLSGVVPFHDQLEALFSEIHYCSSDEDDTLYELDLEVRLGASAEMHS